MKRMLGLDQDYQELKEIGMLGPCFNNISYNLIKRYITTLIFVAPKDKFSRVITTLHEENKCSLSTLKILIFYSVALHGNAHCEESNLNELIENSITKLIGLEEKRCKDVKESRAGRKGLSVEKAKNWLRETFSKSKQKPITRQNRSFSNNNVGLRPRTQTETTQNGDSPMFRPSSIEQPEVKGKQQLLIQNIIIPFAKYLQKLSVSQPQPHSSNSALPLRSEQLWKSINLLNSLLSTSDSFSTIMRYYRQPYQIMVQQMIRVIDSQIKQLYPKLQTALLTKYQLIKKQSYQIYEKYLNNSRMRVEKLQELVFKFEIQEFKEMISDIGKINQSIIGIYLGKYTYHRVKQMGLVQPGLLSDTNDDKFDLIFDILKQIEKSKSQTKRISNSKQKDKLKLNEKSSPSAINKELRLTTNSNPTNNPTFAQKKLKIVEGQRKITIPSSMTLIPSEKIPNQGQILPQSTFRRIRMNNTSRNTNIQDSNTRRLKL